MVGTVTSKLLLFQTRTLLGYQSVSQMSVGPERVRVLVVGDSGVGKTSLTSLIAQGASLPSPGWTVGCSVEVKLHQYLGMA